MQRRVVAADLTLKGSLKGNAIIYDTVHIASSGQLVGDLKARRAYDLQSKVKQFVPPVSSKARESFQPGGAVDLLKLAGAFISPQLQGHVMPTLARILQDRGITPEAATVEQVLQAAGVLKPEKKRRAKRRA